MLVYRGMDIGTAKPTAAERAGVRHHLIDILDVTETATVAEFQPLARAAIADCRARGVIPIVVGGSALYVRAIVDDFEFPGTDPAVRARLEAELAARSARARCTQRLSRRDPCAAARIQPANGRRVVRALEVIELTGRPFSAALPDAPLPAARTSSRSASTSTGRRSTAGSPSGWTRCGRPGLVGEVRGWPSAGCARGCTASRALGYRQVLRYLDGEIGEARGAGADRDGHPEVRPPAGLLVPQGRADPLAAVRPPRPGRRRVRPGRADRDRRGTGGCTPTPRWKTDRMRRWSFAKGHGTENDFVARCSTGRACSTSARRRSASSATGAPGSAPTGCCARCWPSTSTGWDGDGVAVVHGLPQRRRLDRRDVRQRRPGVRPLPAGQGLASRAGSRRSRPGPGCSRRPCCPTAGSGWPWARCGSRPSVVVVTTADGAAFGAHRPPTSATRTR